MWALFYLKNIALKFFVLSRSSFLRKNVHKKGMPLRKTKRIFAQNYPITNNKSTFRGKTHQSLTLISLLNSQSRGARNRSLYIFMLADPRSSKHNKSCRFEIKSMQPGLMIYVTIAHYMLAIICGGLCVNKQLKNNNISIFQLPVRKKSTERDRNACPEVALNFAHRRTWQSIQDMF